MKLFKFRTEEETLDGVVKIHRSIPVADLKEIKQAKYSKAVIVTRSGDEIQTIDSKTKLQKQIWQKD